MLEALMLATLLAATPSPASKVQGSLTVSVEVVESCRFDTAGGRMEVVCNGRVPYRVEPGRIINEVRPERRVEGNQIWVVL